MTNSLHGLIDKYVLWPELKNDFQKNIHFGKVKLKDFINASDSFLQSKSYIEGHMAGFYLNNQKLSQSRIDTQDILGVSQLNDYKSYYANVNHLSQEILLYILVCCTVEARHVAIGSVLHSAKALYKNDPDKMAIIENLPNHEIFKYLKDDPNNKDFIRKFFIDYEELGLTGEAYNEFVDFAAEIVAEVKYIMYSTDDRFDFFANRNAGHDLVATQFLQENFGDKTLEYTLNKLSLMFNDNMFDPGYGGHAWANIANHALRFVQGKISAEVFVDQAFSLEHNSGNIFNKDFLYNNPASAILTFNDYTKDSFRSKNELAVIPSSQIILSAQHLGKVKEIFSLEDTIFQLNKLFLNKPAINQLYEKLKSEEFFVNFPEDYDEAFFMADLENIKTNSLQLSIKLDPIKKQLLALHPNLANELKPGYLDVKELLYNASKNSDELRCATSDYRKNLFFSLWNHLHNNEFNHKETLQYKESFSFDFFNVNDIPHDFMNKEKLGGKALGLAKMNSLDLPVPEAMVYTTDCCHAFFNNKALYKEHLLNSFASIASNVDHPILYSVRSGAPVSMPGMMDTVLNVGIDDSNYDYFCNKMGKKVTHECINKFMELFASSRLNTKVSFHGNLEENLQVFKQLLDTANIAYNKNNILPLDKMSQIEESLHAVFSSWNSHRAVAYRTEKNIDHSLGTAAIIQEMVFGNLNENSCTGVVFSRNCLTGENKLVGEFLPKAQGEDVVSGAVTPFDIEQLKVFNKDIYAQLATIAQKLENQTGKIQDIEFTVENNKLYILQHRSAVCSPIALVKMLEDNALDQAALLEQLDPKNLQHSLSIITNENPVHTGLSGNSGVICGMVIQHEEDMIDLQDKYNNLKIDNPQLGWIFCSELTSPEHMPLMNKTDGFITAQGGFTSHAAIIARSLNKPAIVGTGVVFETGDIITMDGATGNIWQGQQKIVSNNKLAEKFTSILMKSHNIELSSLDKKQFYQHMTQINQEHTLWPFQFPEAVSVQRKIVKKDNFLKLGNKIALLMTNDIKQENNMLKFG